jgi:hypothetical protein
LDLATATNTNTNTNTMPVYALVSKLAFLPSHDLARFSKVS